MKHETKTDSSEKQNANERTGNRKRFLLSKSVDKSTFATLQKNIVKTTAASLKRSIVESLSEKLEMETLAKITDCKKYKPDNL